MKNNISLSNFDFNEFKTEVLSQLKEGQIIDLKQMILAVLYAQR
ncbi:TPA: hypothetical protein ACWM1T_001782 [Legionella pneumophila]